MMEFELLNSRCVCMYIIKIINYIIHIKILYIVLIDIDTDSIYKNMYVIFVILNTFIISSANSI